MTASDYKAQLGITGNVYHNSPTTGAKNVPANPPVPPMLPLAAGDVILDFESNNGVKGGIFFA